MTTVVVVGVDAGPSGAADRLLGLLDWVRGHHPEVDLHVLLLRGGSQIHRFHALAPTTVADWYDRRADLRGATAVVRGARRKRVLEVLIDRWASATLGRRLPLLGADVVLVSGWEALAAGPLGAGPQAPRVALLSAAEAGGRGPTGVTVPGGGRGRARRGLRRAEAVLVDPGGPGAPVDAAAPLVWSAIEQAVAR